MCVPFLSSNASVRSSKVYFCLQGNCIKIWAFSARLTACHVRGRVTPDDDWLPPQISTNRRVQHLTGADPALGVGVSGGFEQHCICPASDQSSGSAGGPRTSNPSLGRCSNHHIPNPFCATLSLLRVFVTRSGYLLNLHMIEDIGFLAFSYRAIRTCHQLFQNLSFYSPSTPVE